MRRLWRDLSLAAKGLIVVAIPVLPLLLTAALYLQNDRASGEARLEAERTTANRLREIEMLALALQAESAVRGFLLIGDPAQLQLKRRAEARAAVLLAELDIGIEDVEQRRRLETFHSAYTDRIAALDAVLQTHRLYGLNSPEMIAQIERGAAAMTVLRTETEALVHRNEELLAARTERAAALRARTTVIILTGAATGILGGIVAVLLFTSGITRRVATATRDAGRLAAGAPIDTAEHARDEIGVLQSGLEQAGVLLAARDRELRDRMTQLENLTKELEAFSYSVSHDLRAPLRHVAGFAALLKKSALDSLTAQQRRYIDTIVEAAERMGRLIDDLLAFSRTGRTEVRREAVDLGDVIRDVRRQLTGEINGRSVDWRIAALPKVYGDQALLRVVFDNLIGNAIKYTRGRDRASLEIGTRTDGGDTIVYVRDNGVGFDMQYQHKLFGVFQRLHSSDQFEGTGIGLATVRRIVARHGGRVWAEGRPDEGATFYVALPTEKSAA